MYIKGDVVRLDICWVVFNILGFFFYLIKFFLFFMINFIIVYVVKIMKCGYYVSYGVLLYE